MDTTKKKVKSKSKHSHEYETFKALLNHELGFREFCRFYKDHQCTWFTSQLVSYYRRLGYTEQICKDTFGGCLHLRDGRCCFDCENREKCISQTLCINWKVARDFNPSSRNIPELTKNWRENK